jgi:hypothetical protein
VGSIAVLRRRFGAPRNQRDALLIAVRESKLSVVEFDPATLSLVNSSLHSWETAVRARLTTYIWRRAPNKTRRHKMHSLILIPHTPSKKKFLTPSHVTIARSTTPHVEGEEVWWVWMWW